MRDLGGFFGSEKFFDEHETEIESGAGTTRGDEALIHNHALAGHDRCELTGHGEMRRVSFSGQQTGIVQNCGRSADGGQPAAGISLSPDKRNDAWISTEIFHTRTSGEDEKIEGASLGQRGKRGVRMQGDAAASGDMDSVGQRSDDHLGTGAPQQIDGGDGFNFLKTLWQNKKNRGHGWEITTMSTDAPERLSGKRLVIFGVGYVGGAFARQACSAGVDVVLLTRNAANARAFAAEGMRVVVADLADPAWHGQIAGGADWVVNCVAGGGAGVDGYRHSYLEGMRAVASWLERNGAEAAIYTSSTSVYPQDGGMRVDESADVDRVRERPRILLETEDVLLNLPKAVGRRTVLRLAGIYGPGRHHLLEQVRQGEVSGHPGHHLNLIHRDDVCAAIWRALLPHDENARVVTDGGIFNVADDGAATKAEVVNWLAVRMGLPEPVFTGAAAPGRQQVTPDRIIDNARIKRVLGWRPGYASFREGYAEILGA